MAKVVKLSDYRGPQGKKIPFNVHREVLEFRRPSDSSQSSPAVEVGTSNTPLLPIMSFQQMLLTGNFDEIS